MQLKNILSFFTLASFGFALFSCQNPAAESIFYGSLGLQQKLIVASSTSISGSPYIISQYALDGTFEKILYDATGDNKILRSMAPLDALNFFIATDTNDGILKYNMLSGASQFVSNGNLSGNIYNIRRKKSTGEIFVVESTGIESFDEHGNRLGNPRIGSTAIGSCQLNGTVRGMDFDSAGHLIVASQGNDDILFYDVSNPNDTLCLAANQTPGNVDPIAVVAHTDGSVYVANMSGTDSVVRINGDGSGSATDIWTGTTTSNPTAMIEMPDGSLLVALDGTNRIIRIDTSGNVLNDPFIQDGFTSYVQDMMITEAP
jgi:hypothetical protein